MPGVRHDATLSAPASSPSQPQSPAVLRSPNWSAHGVASLIKMAQGGKLLHSYPLQAVVPEGTRPLPIPDHEVQTDHHREPDSQIDGVGKEADHRGRTGDNRKNEARCGGRGTGAHGQHDDGNRPDGEKPQPDHVADQTERSVLREAVLNAPHDPAYDKSTRDGEYRRHVATVRRQQAEEDREGDESN